MKLVSKRVKIEKPSPFLCCRFSMEGVKLGLNGVGWMDWVCRVMGIKITLSAHKANGSALEEHWSGGPAHKDAIYHGEK